VNACNDVGEGVFCVTNMDDDDDEDVMQLLRLLCKLSYTQVCVCVRLHVQIFRCVISIVSSNTIKRGVLNVSKHN